MLQIVFIIAHQNQFIRIFGKPDPRSWIFGLKPSQEQNGANKKKFSQIGPAIPELLKDTYTLRQTYRQ